MTDFLQLAFVLAVILFTAKAAGYLSTRLGQPSVLGELLVGVLLGPSLLNITQLSFITNTHLHDFVIELGELGVLLLMFIAGLELHLSELTRNMRVSAFAGVLGVVVPVAAGYLVGDAFGLEFNHSMFLGITLAATSVSISAQTLLELRKLRTPVGMGLLGAAVFDDVLVILLLSAFLALESGGSTGQVLLLVLRMAGFLAASVAFGRWALPGIVRWVSKLPISQGLLSLALIVMLVYGLAAELLGNMAAITGAFIAGLMFARTPEKSLLETPLRAAAYGLFVPIFFISIGLRTDLKAMDTSAILLFLVISVVAIISKLAGAGLGARLGKFSWRESLQLGIGMISRGEVGLIVGSAGLQAGLLNQTAFSAIIGTVLVTTLVTPPLLRWSFKEPKPKREHNRENQNEENEVV